MATLIIVEGPAEGQKFALATHGLVMIGRDHTCTFQILDARLSRMHLQIKRDGETGGHSAIDFDSANGVYVNGERIAAATQLSDGDVIRAGNTSIVYSVDDTPDAQSLSRLLRQHYQGHHQTQIDE